MVSASIGLYGWVHVQAGWMHAGRHARMRLVAVPPVFSCRVGVYSTNLTKELQFLYQSGVTRTNLARL